MYRGPVTTDPAGLMDRQFLTNEFSREPKISFRVNQHKNIILPIYLRTLLLI